MIFFTMIARIADGLPLVASMQEDEQLSRHIVEYQNQAKQLVRRLTPTSPSRCSLIAGPYLFHYLIDRGVCYLILTENQFARAKAFAFLEDLQIEFFKQYANEIHTVSRPYSFLDFDRYISKSQKAYTDSRSNVSQLNVALQDVQRIMVQNMDDVLRRGEALSDLNARASDLHVFSKKYRQDAHTLNTKSMYVKYIFVAVVLLIVVYLVFFW